MVRFRTIVLLTALALLAGSCGSGRSHREVLQSLTREYQKLTEYLKLVESEDDASRLRRHIQPAVNKIVDLTRELESLEAPSTQEEAEVAQMRAQLDSASKACRNRLRRALRIEGVPEILECLEKRPGDTG